MPVAQYDCRLFTATPTRGFVTCAEWGAMAKVHNSGFGRVPSGGTGA